MKIKILRATTINGNDREPRGETDRVEEGDIVSVTQATAQLLVGMGKAEHADKTPLIEQADYEKEEAAEEAPEEVETATVEAAETAEAPRARRR
jgi:hypothetical protein